MFALRFMPPMLVGCASPMLPELRIDGAERVTAGVDSEQNPCVSPDGSQLVFTRFHKNYNVGPTALVLLDLTTGSESTLLDDGEHDFVNLPGRCFSPDGRTITYSSDVQDHDEIWLLDLEDGSTHLLTRNAFASTEPSFNQDGSQVVFQSSDGPIFRIGVDGMGQMALTDGKRDRQPSASPVDDSVLFQSDRAGTVGLWQVKQGVVEQVLDDEAEETDASWSFDGETVVFATDACTALSCTALLRGASVVVYPTPARWYEGAPALAPNGAVFMEAHPGRPGRTAIYRLPDSWNGE